MLDRREKLTYSYIYSVNFNTSKTPPPLVQAGPFVVSITHLTLTCQGSTLSTTQPPEAGRPGSQANHLYG